MNIGVLHAADAPLSVVTSFSILGDIAREVGGPDVKVDTLVGPDGDAHSYEPTPQDAKRLSTARVLVVNGLDFEAWLPRLTQSSGFKGQTIVASTGVTPRPFESGHDDDDHEHDHGKAGAAAHSHGDDRKHGGAGHAHDAHAHGSNDPHAWQDLRNGMRYAQNIAEGFAAADPAHAVAYRARAAAYVERLQALNTRITAQFAAIPAAQRKVVTSHDAFGYFGQAYGITFIAPVGMSTDAEPSAADMARLIGQVKRDTIRAVFVENISSPRLVEQIARETGARTGGTLYSDALSKPGQPAATYLGMFEWNAKQLVNALQP
ncbi:zinc ABC transporter substrate-binding protein [Alcaligenaceae bacterium A4P071]|nr:zinc ABC transporter substrate-binding protein [Alcaligenaceae bacterium B3P038]MDQ2185921.1 zinc ABC transporter substrate-binding protein [Alcaligenaceae bacterium A4P071]